MDEILDINDLMTYLKLKRSTVYNLVEGRKIPFYKVGRLLRFRRSDIDAWLEGYRIEPALPGGDARIVKAKVKHNPCNIPRISKMDIGRLVRKTVDRSKGKRYIQARRENQPDDPVKEGKEVFNV